MEKMQVTMIALFLFFSRWRSDIISLTACVQGVSQNVVWQWEMIDLVDWWFEREKYIPITFVFGRAHRKISTGPIHHLGVVSSQSVQIHICSRDLTWCHIERHTSQRPTCIVSQDPRVLPRRTSHTSIT